MIKLIVAIYACFMLNSHGSFADERRINPYILCVENQRIKDVDTCLEKVGRIEWYPYKSPDTCVGTKEILKIADQNGWKLSWKLLYMNERCRRLGDPFYKRDSQP